MDGTGADENAAAPEIVTVRIPYARGTLPLQLEAEFVRAVLEPGMFSGTVPVSTVQLQRGPERPAADDSSAASQEALVQQALANPIGAPRLRDLASSARTVLIITSDHTRPLPSVITLPLLLEEIRGNNPAVAVKILVATGFHRLSRTEELIGKFGEAIFQREEIVVHDSHDQAHLVFKGLLPSGGELWLNSLVDWADLIVAEGFIEPHFFAGFSGGRKSVLPGIAGAVTVLANHCSAFIASPQARTGNLKDNLLHRDMLFAAQTAGLAFILNVALDAEKRIIRAFAGDADQAHLQGCNFVASRASIPRVTADIVITSNGGYPLDQNIYQAVKGMTAGAACVRSGGVLIMAAACEDGHGGDAFYRWFADARSPAEVAKKIATIDRQHTQPDQWEAQILARILIHCTVILVTDRCDPAIIRSMHMLHAPDLPSALALARAKVGVQAEIVVIPDGVGVIVEP